MEGTRDAFFDPETIAILKAVLDEAWSCLPAGQTNVTRSLLAERILKAARDGERDPGRLRTHAMAQYSPPVRALRRTARGSARRTSHAHRTAAMGF
jgi:hypothetical protein